MRILFSLFTLRTLLLILVLVVAQALPIFAETPPDPFAPPPGISAESLAAYERGRLIFNAHWRPSGTDGPDDFEGLGPFYNRISCSSCHNAGGRGRVPASAREPFLTAIVKVGVRGADGSFRPHPIFGEQIQDRAIPDVELEARISLNWEEIPGTYADGTEFTLRKPVLTVRPDPGESAEMSVRVAQPVRGLGLLEGRGGFGWKAAQPTLEHQNAAAFSGDMGLTTVLFPAPECPSDRPKCGGGPNEVGDQRLKDLTHFVRLMTPRSRTDPVSSSPGQRLFAGLGCIVCHDPMHPSLSDMALHDMGPGLDDGLPEGEAKSFEWRTQPLWGLGTILTGNPSAPLLHDGRARGAAEAILWHGGEAATSAEAFRNLSADQRAALIKYLSGL